MSAQRGIEEYVSASCARLLIAKGGRPLPAAPKVPHAQNVRMMSIARRTTKSRCSTSQKDSSSTAANSGRHQKSPKLAWLMGPMRAMQINQSRKRRKMENVNPLFTRYAVAKFNGGNVARRIPSETKGIEHPLERRQCSINTIGVRSRAGDLPVVSIQRHDQEHDSRDQGCERDPQEGHVNIRRRSVFRASW